ncbi:uncharacterized protein IWZ02DRAFT_442592 [Phyllosticta citriasiana]|uniref:uncharacterized protein n=1 Tax=Phyllosticta citriasiana TaxID=595635 RepID=UPI0030FDF530
MRTTVCWLSMLARAYCPSEHVVCACASWRSKTGKQSPSSWLCTSISMCPTTHDSFYSRWSRSDVLLSRENRA